MISRNSLQLEPSPDAISTDNIMVTPIEPIPLSRLRARLASFEYAYAVALRMHQEFAQPCFVIHTGNSLQPYRVSFRQPPWPELWSMMIA